ncbi:MAG: Hsp70 family protein [Lentisphaerae bacterium]|nr:Hsp70 family protein [Lentisphaerota bacterium]
MEKSSKGASRYTVGIDLGTTNCVLSYVDGDDVSAGLQVLAIPQLIAAGEIAALPRLASYIYLPAGSGESKDLNALPWQKEASAYLVGEYARQMGSKTPSRVISSAKSWLCSSDVDPRSDCLPIAAEDPAEQLSPVMATQLILEHLRDAWNYCVAKGDKKLFLQNQELIITVPASFEPMARDLTVEAATAAGLTFSLLEEPQAAFYSWLSDHEDSWRKIIQPGDVVLVCDIGGGTSDFSLIIADDSDGELALQRLAVGEHTLLGGDNMDLTLAYAIAAKLKKEKGLSLTAHQISGLVHACRQAKEHFGGGAQEPFPLTVLGRGTGVVAGTISTTLSRDEWEAMLLEGFFPSCAIDESLAGGAQSGLRGVGLRYAADPAFTRHLANFLNLHSFRDADGRPILPTLLLFNGGVAKASAFREKLVEALADWRGAGAPKIQELAQRDSDMAVARGAAWLGHIRRSGGIRIKAGSARAFYIGVEAPMPAVPGFTPPQEALCVVNYGLEEGSEVDIAAGGLALVVGEPTQFRFYASTTRQQDAVGDRLSDWQDGELTELPPLQATLPYEDDNKKAGAMVPVRLRAVLTDIGTVQLWCDELKGKGSWKLEVDLRQQEDKES